jgi:hypothetical protein
MTKSIVILTIGCVLRELDVFAAGNSFQTKKKREYATSGAPGRRLCANTGEIAAFEGVIAPENGLNFHRCCCMVCA